MIRRIIHIDEEKCNGCGACASACHESAIGMVDGKARLLRDDYCDGMGDCLPECPTGAITFTEREAAAYDKDAVAANRQKKTAANAAHVRTGGCPGSRMRVLDRGAATETPRAEPMPSRLANWPPQIRLTPSEAPYFDGADLLVAADCTAYSYGSFHEDFMKGRTTLIGCPKLDATDYAERLTPILTENRIQSVTVARMEVPCCGGLEAAVRRAVAASGKNIPLRVVTIGINGRIRGEKEE